MTFKGYWPHHLHDLAERRSQIPTTIGHIIYMTQRKDVHRYPRPLATSSTWLSAKTFTDTHDHWPHHLHDSAERRSQIPTTIGHIIYMTQRKDVHRYPRPLATSSTWLSGKTFTDTHDHWPHHLHDSAQRRSQIPRTIGHIIYMTQRKDVHRYPGPLTTSSTWLSAKTFTDTQDHWPHHLHDLAERRSQIPTTIGHIIYMTQRKDVHRYPGPLATSSTWLSAKTFTDTHDHWPHHLHDSAQRRSQIPTTIGHIIYMTQRKDVHRYPGPLPTSSTWLSANTFDFYYDY